MPPCPRSTYHLGWWRRTDTTSSCHTSTPSWPSQIKVGGPAASAVPSDQRQAVSTKPRRTRSPRTYLSSCYPPLGTYPTLTPPSFHSPFSAFLFCLAACRMYYLWLFAHRAGAPPPFFFLGFIFVQTDDAPLRGPSIGCVPRVLNALHAFPTPRPRAKFLKRSGVERRGDRNHCNTVIAVEAWGTGE